MKGKKRAAPTVAQHAALTGLLTAQAIVLSFLENLLPLLPFLPPGAKLGLSNLVVLYAAMDLSLPSALCIAIMKAFFVLVTRGGAAFAMSLCGGLLSALAMGLLLRMSQNRLGLVGVCVGGAVCHNLGQLLAACVLSASNLLFYLPALLLFGVLAGILTGVVIRLLLPALRKQLAVVVRHWEPSQ